MEKTIKKFPNGNELRVEKIGDKKRITIVDNEIGMSVDLDKIDIALLVNELLPNGVPHVANYRDCKVNCRYRETYNRSHLLRT